MAILNSVSASPTILARVSTAQSFGLTLPQCREHFYKLLMEQGQLLEDAEMGSDEALRAHELMSEFFACLHYLDECIEGHKQPVPEQNAMQVASTSISRTVGELRTMLNKIEAAWTGQDTEFLGNFNDMPLCIIKDDGIHNTCVAFFQAEHGLLIETEERA